MEIEPRQGIGPLRFGMTPSEVVAVLDEPQVYEAWMGGNLNGSLLYHGMVLSFDRCSASGPLPNSRLTYIRLEGREDAIIFGRQWTEWTEAMMFEELASRRVQHDVDRGEQYCQISVPAAALELLFWREGPLHSMNMDAG